jgi:hypothetical protein
MGTWKALRAGDSDIMHACRMQGAKKLTVDGGSVGPAVNRDADFRLVRKKNTYLRFHN